MHKHKNSHFLGAAVLLALAAHATPARADFNIEFGQCSPISGNTTHDHVSKSVYNLGPGEAKVVCVRTDLAVNIRRVEAEVFDGSNVADISCQFKGVDRNEQPTFGPVSKKSVLDGRRSLFITVPNNNQTRRVDVTCTLPAPDPATRNASGVYRVIVKTR